jgi:hypothetical protein
MYILINPHPFHLNITPTIATPASPPKFNPEGVLVPYTQEGKLTIDATFTIFITYFKMWKNIYCSCYNTLDVHVNDAFKVAPPPPHTQPDGIQQCPFMTFLTSLQPLMENKH